MTTRRSMLIGISGGLAAGTLLRARPVLAVMPASAFFPVDPGRAPFPSPEGSRMRMILKDGRPVIAGAPYLRNGDGAVHRLVPVLNTDPHKTWSWGKKSCVYKINDYIAFSAVELRVAQGQVYLREPDGSWFQVTQSLGVNHASLPPYWTRAVPLTTDPEGDAAIFPADPARAKKPSPEYSSSLWLDGKLHGAPYLIDKDGHRYQIAPSHDALKTELLIDGKTPGFYSGQDQRRPAQIQIRQGVVYTQINTTQWQRNGYNVALPSGYVPGSNQPPMPAGPAEPPVWGGTSGRVLEVGAAGHYRSIKHALDAAQDGDTVLVGPGVYQESLGVTKAVLLQGRHGAKIDVTRLGTARTYQGKGAVILQRTGAIVDGFEVVGAGLDQDGPHMTCGIRVDGEGKYKIRNVHVHHCQMGIGTSNIENTALEGENWHLRECGLNDGGTHNIYVGAIASLVIKGLNSYRPKGGHAVKSRAHYTEIDGLGGRAEAESATVVDLPDGTGKPAIIRDLVLLKPAASSNRGILDYAVESTSNGTTGLEVIGCKIDAQCPEPFVLVGGGPVRFVRCKFLGNMPVAAGNGASMIKGLPA